MAKYKMTLFARFFIFLIIIIPVAFVIANYINGEDGIEKFLDLFRSNRGDTTEMTTTPPPPIKDSVNQVTISREDILQQKNDSIDLLKQELEDCRSN